MRVEDVAWRQLAIREMQNASRVVLVGMSRDVEYTSAARTEDRTDGCRVADERLHSQPCGNPASLFFGTAEVVARIAEHDWLALSGSPGRLRSQPQDAHEGATFDHEPATMTNGCQRRTRRRTHGEDVQRGRRRIVGHAHGA
jgi:hypothetical protein